MLALLIRHAIKNRFMVLLFTVVILVWGIISIQKTPLDAIPDLSDVQVIIKTSYPGQSPQVIEDQVTYPLSTTMLSVPKAIAVRGYSFFGDSYVYVVFDDDTDLYWARARVIEYLSQAASKLPEGASPQIGPDATGVGWVYEYALVDRTGKHSLTELTSIQNWFLKYELQTVKGVAEVASVGGLVKEYQVIVDLQKMIDQGVTLTDVKKAIKNANQETGGAVELGEVEHMLRVKGYLGDNIDDIGLIAVGIDKRNQSILLRDIATIKLGSQFRRGIAELDGEGEVVGGIIVMRDGENALSVIENVKLRIASLSKGLPEGVEIVSTYDRSKLINNAVSNLYEKIAEELLVVALVCFAFLFHLRSALVAIVSLPLGILAAFIIMHQQGINANIMSLGGIAIAIGAMIDAAIVMIENAHKHLERFKQRHGTMPIGRAHWEIITQAAIEVGPALFFSLLIITLSFIPIFSLENQEGRLFSPLAYTKTYAMAVSAGLAITLIPVLMGFFIRGNIPSENKNPISRILIAIYKPLLTLCLRFPIGTIVVAVLLMLTTFIPLNNLGSEFMPELEEGDLLYMPTTLPGVSLQKAQELLIQTDKAIKEIPEVERVFGKIGRANTATDPAPLTMIETTILLKPKSEWREGLSLDDLIKELDESAKFPGLINAWIQPIKTRIDMLATGIKTPVGIKISGTNLKTIETIGKDIEAIISKLPGTSSVFSERVSGGRYLDVNPNREKLAQYGLSIAQLQEVINTATGAMSTSTTKEGLERYPIHVQFNKRVKTNINELMQLPLSTPTGEKIQLSDIAEIAFIDGPPMIKTENARLNGWVFVDIRGVDLGGYVESARQQLAKQLKLPAGYSIAWVGQYEYMIRVKNKLKLVIPFTLMIIFVLLYLTFRSFTAASIVMLSLPFALAGGVWLLWLLEFNFSIAVAVGFIALAGVAAEFGVIMLVYLNNALKEYREEGKLHSTEDLKDAIIEGAAMRIRPKAMTVAVIVGGLVPIMLGSGAGSDVMQRIAAPMIGGMVTAPLLSLFVIPAIYLIWKRLELQP